MDNTDTWSGREVSDITASEYTGLMESHIFNTSQLHQALHGDLKNCSLAKELDQAAEGTGLAFIVMADVFTKLPGAPFWSFLFFAMLLSLGLGSQIGILEGFISTLFDMPRFRRIPKPVLTGAACGICFLIGLLFTTGAGEYWLTLFDSYGAMGLALIALAEILAVMYVYGHRRFTDDIEQMTGVRPGLYWQITWRFVAPILLTTIVVASIISQVTKSPSYTAWDVEQVLAVKLPYTSGAIGIAFVLAAASLVPIALIAVIRLFRCVESDTTEYQGPIKRISTNASTIPMMAGSGGDANGGGGDFVDFSGDGSSSSDDDEAGSPIKCQTTNHDEDGAKAQELA